MGVVGGCRRVMAEIRAVGGRVEGRGSGGMRG